MASYINYWGTNLDKTFLLSLTKFVNSIDKVGATSLCSVLSTCFKILSKTILKSGGMERFSFVNGNFKYS